MERIIFLPFRGEFGHLLMWHAPMVNAFPGEKIACCEEGQEALFPGVLCHYLVPRNKDKNRNERVGTDRAFLTELRTRLELLYPGSKLRIPEEETSKSPRKYFVPKPAISYGISCDVVVTPRRRGFAKGRNWQDWPGVVKELQMARYKVFAVGAPDSSSDVGCDNAWSRERFLDASIEAILSSKLVVATDNGLAHLAVQCGKPVLMITLKGTPGPGCGWDVKWRRYRAENHLKSPIFYEDLWKFPEKVANRSLEILREMEK